MIKMYAKCLSVFGLYEYLPGLEQKRTRVIVL